MKSNRVSWRAAISNPRDLEHWLLITGIVLIILSFGADLFVKLAHQS